MADDADVLESYGIPVRKLAKLIRTVRALAGGALEDLAAVVKPAGRGRPPGRRGPGRPRGAGRSRKARGTFKVAKEELAKLKETMTGKQIAQKYNVSLSTVQNRLRAFGLTSGKRGRPAKKK